MALAVMLAMLVLQGVAASGELHNHLHHHSDEPDHECMVTQMLSGGYGCELPDMLPVDVVSEVPEVPALVLAALNLAPSHLVGGVLAHAPPRGP